MRGEGCIHLEEGPLPFWSSFSALFCSRPCPGAFFSRTGVSLEDFCYICSSRLLSSTFFLLFGRPEPPPESKKPSKTWYRRQKTRVREFLKNVLPRPSLAPSGLLLGILWVIFGLLGLPLVALGAPRAPKSRQKARKKCILNLPGRPEAPKVPQSSKMGPKRCPK